MNKCIFIGRLTKDVELTYTQDATNPMAVAKYTIAVNRNKKDAPADFLNCIAFGKAAEFVGKYFKKADKICVVGRLQTGSYINKDQQKVYTTDIIVEEQEFVDSKNEGSGTPAASTQPRPQEAEDLGKMPWEK